MKTLCLRALLIISILSIVACGGGGGSDPGVSSSSSSSSNSTSSSSSSSTSTSSGSSSSSNSSSSSSSSGTIEDPTPDDFSFTSVDEVLPNTYVESNPVTIAGVSDPVPVVVVNGEIKIGEGEFTSSPATISNGQLLTVRQVSALEVSTSKVTTVTVGDMTRNFETTTSDIFNNSAPRPVISYFEHPFNNIQAEEDVVENSRVGSIQAIDFDRDGDLDIFATLAAGAAGRIFYQNNGAAKPAFTPVSLAAYPEGYLIPTNLDGDESYDFVISTSSGTIIWLEDANLANNAVPVLPAVEGRTIYNTHIADVNDDGHNDIVFVGRFPDEEVLFILYWLENNGATNPEFTLNPIAEIDATQLRDFKIGDLNGNGKMDFLICDNASGAWALLDNGNENLEWTILELNASYTGLTYSAIGNIDGDNDNDIVLARPDANALEIYLNNGESTPVFGVIPQVLIAAQVDAVEIIDMDFDGDGDIVFENFLEIASVTFVDTLNWYENTGLTNERMYTRTHALARDYGWHKVLPFDLNSDGTYELVTFRADDPFEDPFNPPFGWYDTSDVQYSVTPETQSSEPLSNHVTDTQNNVLTYDIVGGPDEALFSIENGHLMFSAPSTANPQDYDSDNIYRVRVSANDGYLTTNFLFAVYVD